jgi:hypothetical protein
VGQHILAVYLLKRGTQLTNLAPEKTTGQHLSLSLNYRNHYNVLGVMQGGGLQILNISMHIRIQDSCLRNKGEVKIVVIILIKPAEKMVILEK